LVACVFVIHCHVVSIRPGWLQKVLISC